MMMKQIMILRVLYCLILAGMGRISASETQWKAGVAKVAVTPQQSMWMAGYASRNKPSEGKVHDLHVKALALEDQDGHRIVFVTADLISIPRDLRNWLQDECQKKYSLSPDSLLLNASHTHCGPELRSSKVSLYGAAAEQVSHTESYYNNLKQQVLELVGTALQNLQPAKIGYTHGRAGFAMNRRLPTETEPRNAPYPDGPVDHDVPILKIESEAGELKALLFGYACHNTTLGFYQFCGDYAGFAQYDLETAFPGAVAMFMTGCGGDQNPQPRGELALAEHHGSTLANAVKAGLLGPVRPIEGTLRSAIEPVELEFATPPNRDELETLQKSNVEYSQRRATALLKQLDEQGRIPTDYQYLVQVVRLGDQVTMVALSGEVVIDYSLRLKQELNGDAAVWVAGYSNDVFGYVPSLRVLKEGGYEGGGAMQFTTLPGPFAESVESRIVDKVHQLVKKTENSTEEK
jgi:neutral ceramidase